MRSSIFLSYAAFVLVGIGAAAGGVLLPAQIADYGVDKALIGLIFFTSSAGFLLAGLTNGALIERLGLRLSLVAGSSAFVLAAVITAARPPFWALIAVQGLAGYGSGVLESVLNVHLAALPNAATLLNRLHAFFGVGALAGPVIAAWTLNYASWTAVWWGLAAATALMAVAFMWTFPKKVVQEKEEKQKLTNALRNRYVLLAAAFLTVYLGVEIGVGNWAYSYLREVNLESHLVAGYAVSGYWAGLTAGRFVINPLAGRFRMTPARTSLWCCVGVAGTTVLIWLGVVPIAGFVLLGFFLGPLFPTTMAILPDLLPARLVPTAIGVLNGGSVIGGSALPWLAGALGQGAGMWALMPFALTLALAQLAIWFYLSAPSLAPRTK
ncbi:MFS transporter [Herbidospora mongoliensis]|uniref:MFS transporter n=1 Tax=Herbidospora mongoliensis TaxID=688067 RepID=UPI00082A4D0A|nr:MFS transporter [Herbidospora mongoliensis]